jgi:hypothetical protein
LIGSLVDGDRVGCLGGGIMRGVELMRMMMGRGLFVVSLSMECVPRNEEPDLVKTYFLIRIGIVEMYFARHDRIPLPFDLSNSAGE